MGLEPTTPCLQTRPTRTMANTDGRLRQGSSLNRTMANACERLRALPRCYHGRHEPASPRKTTMARSSRTTSSLASRPTRSPSLERRTVVILSTIMLQASCRPFWALGSTNNRKRGASVGSVVNAHTVTESVASKRSSWTMTTGLGLPAYPEPAEAVHISPRFTPRRPRSTR